MTSILLEQLPSLVASTDDAAMKEFFDAVDRSVQDNATNEFDRCCVDAFSHIINGVVDNEDSPTKVFLNEFKQQCAYLDVCLAALNSALDIVKSGALSEDQRKMRNYFLMLQCMSPNDGPPSFLGAQSERRYKPSRLRKMFTESWLEFVRVPMEMSLRCDCLVWLSENVLRNVSSPMLFADFVTNCFQMEHPSNALALGSVVVLMLQCNMNYPKLYDEVYNMLQPNIFTMPHRTVFLRNLDLIMRSTHLPVYLTAAFIKRLSRLLLFAPVECCLTFLGFIRNWLIRHPSCQFLVNRSWNEAQSLDADPYDFDATDPANSNSMTTSLWEIQTLKHHYVDKVVRTAAFIDCPLPSVEVPFRLESNANRVFRDEVKAAPKEYVVAEGESSKLFEISDVVGQLFAP
uniref:CBF domain-containing protein n=1 Tax=Trichuris muris TaxID=70415 RepID=A0A5S6QT84_TRIMR